MHNPGSSADDADDLVLRVRAGDEAAFEQLFRAYHARLCSFVNGYVRSREVAEEIVQDLFFAIWSQREQWVVSGNLRGYLYGAARNRALNHVKRSSMEKRWLEGAAAEQDAAFQREVFTDSQDAQYNEESIDALRRALALLPERCALIMTMRWQHQLRYAEIAEALGISVKGVEHQLQRGMRALRAHFTAK
jgi:RNA polymerase sigma-70 factor, ECF subfamily